jgi:hypothetical protein
MSATDLPSIDPTQLAAVTGGTSSSDAATQMLQQLMSSIKDLAQNQNGGSSNQFMQMLPMFMMMSQRQQAAPAPAPEPPPGDGWIRVL